jgi:outer membrane autotransporter protein
LMAYNEKGPDGRIENGQYLASGSGGGGADLMLGAQAGDYPVEPISRFDVWVRGQWAHVDDETRESDIGLLYVGADYLINPDFLVGFLAQFDWMDQKDTTEDIAVDGVGWMAGPYVVARLHQNLLFDGRVAWGQSDNDVNPLGLYTDDFDTDRWLAKAQLTGDFRRGDWRFSPFVRAIYFEEHQKAYTDSLGTPIPSQTVSLGRVTFGPEVSYVFRTDTMEVEPRIGIQGIWDFDKAEIVDLSSGLAAGSSADLRARIEGGLAFRLANGASLTADAFYDGVGVDDLDMYGGSVKVRVPLN